MNERFEIGEVAVINFPGNWAHGKDVLILSEPALRMHRFGGGVIEPVVTQLVEIDGSRTAKSGVPRGFEPRHFRKKRPPQQFEAGDWSQCIFTPKQLVKKDGVCA